MNLLICFLLVSPLKDIQSRTN